MRYLVLLLWLGMTCSLPAQSPVIPTPVAGLKFSTSFTLEETTFHQVNAGIPISTLSPLDLAKLQRYTIRKQVEYRIAEDNHYSSTVTILNPDEAYSEFPVHIGRIEINQSGMQIFDAAGALYHTVPADSAYTAEYNSARASFTDYTPNIMFNFPESPSPQKIAEIEQLGGSVSFLPDSSWVIGKGSIQAKYDPNAARITTSTYEGERLAETRIQRFAVTPQGIYAPVTDITKRQVVRPSGACMEDVVQRKYSNYSIAVSPTLRNRAMSAATLKQTFAWPNPAANQLNIALGSNVKPESAMAIIDLTGRVVLS